MIRRAVKGVLRRALGRDRPAPTPSPRAAASSAPARSAPTPAPEPEPEPEPDVEVDDATLKAWLADGREIALLDIRERHEVRMGWLAGSRWIPMNSVPERVDELPRDQVLVVYCAAGMRSFGVAHWLREQGFEEAWSLVGGAGAGVEAGLTWDQDGPPEA